MNEIINSLITCGLIGLGLMFLFWISGFVLSVLYIAAVTICAGIHWVWKQLTGN